MDESYAYDNYDVYDNAHNVDHYYDYSDGRQDAYYSSDGTRLPTSPSPAYRHPSNSGQYWQGDVPAGHYYTDEGQELDDGYDQQHPPPTNLQSQDDYYTYSDPSSRDYYDSTPQERVHVSYQPAPGNMNAQRSAFQSVEPVVHVPRNKHGIQLKPVSSLPDMYRSLFKFGVFNAMQSKCFDTAVHADENMIISAPTGSGKTVLFELALIRLLMSGDSSAKCVYMAPTKALCNERYGDWTSKFQSIGVKCCQLTGDTVETGRGAWSEAKKSTIIITTPEKWDSLTRNWRDHGQILAQMRLFLVDEVHILNDARGSTLEVCISRMRLRGNDVRFMLLSATVPNIEDVASWIGSAMKPNTPAAVFTFGEEFRPCPIKRVVYGYPRKPKANEFQFNKTLDYKLFSVLSEHCQQKPVIVFCATRKGVSSTAELIAKEYKEVISSKGRLPWPIPRASEMNFQDKSLQELGKVGVGMHHAGLDQSDRRTTEDLFTRKVLSVIVATSTLAVGVNFPAHTVIIKGTKQWVGNGWAEYSDLDILQMMGRAGRPQFDKEGVAILMTEQSQEAKHRALMGGRTLLESSLHHNLTEHINSEIQLGTISSSESAQEWLRNSFLFRRIQKNPNHYGMGKSGDQTWDGRLATIVEDSLHKLKETELVDDSDAEGTLRATEYGEIMSRYYIRYPTMCSILKLVDKASIRDILEMISNAEEFQDLRLRQSEKAIYNKMRQDTDIRFRIQKIEKVGDKVMTLIQAVLGGLPLGSPEYKCPDATAPQFEATNVFRHAGKLAKAVVEVGIIKRNAHHIKFGMELVRSINAKAWEDRPNVLRQIPHIGDKSIKTLALAGIIDLDTLRKQQPTRIELLLNRHPPFGREVLAAVQAMPDYGLRVDELVLSSSRGQKPVSVTLHIEASVTCELPKGNSKRGKPSSLGMTSILTINSDMDLLDFRRIPTKALIEETRNFEVELMLTKPSQTVTVSISGDNFAGLTRSQTYKPALSPAEYPTLDTRPLSDVAGYFEGIDMNSLWEDFEADFVDLTAAAGTVRDDQATQKGKGAKEDAVSQPGPRSVGPRKLPNGNYSCNHTCKDKTKCRHLCCREGLPTAPPASRPQAALAKEDQSKSTRTQTMDRPTQWKLEKQRTDKRLSDLETLHSASAHGTRTHVKLLPTIPSKSLTTSTSLTPKAHAPSDLDDDDSLIDPDDIFASTLKRPDSGALQPGPGFGDPDCSNAADLDLTRSDDHSSASSSPLPEVEQVSESLESQHMQASRSFDTRRDSSARNKGSKHRSPSPLPDSYSKRRKLSNTEQTSLTSTGQKTSTSLARFKNSLSHPTQFAVQFSADVPEYRQSNAVEDVVPLFRPDSDDAMPLDTEPTKAESYGTHDLNSPHDAQELTEKPITHDSSVSAAPPKNDNSYADVLKDFEQWLADPNNVEIIP